MSRLRRLWTGLTKSGAATTPDAEDPRLRGRTYAIPFDVVWSAAVAVADGGLPHWRLVEADDHEGVIRAESAAGYGAPSDVVVRITLDANAQTRVDARATYRGARGDLGACARRITRFFRALDRDLARGEPARR
jgi:hypothetical protein